MPGHRLKLKHFKLIHRSKSINKKARKHEKEFIEAVIEDDIEQLKKLTKHKIDINAPILWNDEYVYPIHIGCALGSLEVVKFLFRTGSVLETESDSGMTPLHFSSAFNNNHPEVTGHLLDMGARTNVKENLRGYTPFHFASENNNFGAVKRLLEVTKRFLPDDKGKTAKDIAIENDCVQIVALLEAYDEEHKQREELKSLPRRIETLEKKTDFLLSHRRLASCGDSAIGGFLDCEVPWQSDQIYVNNDGETLLKLRSFGSLPASARASQRKKKVSSLISEHQFNALLNNLAPPPCRTSKSVSPIRKEFADQVFFEEEEMATVLTRDSPISKQHRQQIVRHYSFLLSMVKPEKIIIKLFSKNYVDLQGKERLNKMATEQEKIDFILTNYILKGSMALYEDFLQVLRDCNMEHIAETLDKVPMSSSSSDEINDLHSVSNNGNDAPSLSTSTGKETVL